MSATQAVGIVDERKRSRRDTLLLAGGATLTGAAVLLVVEAILGLVDLLDTDFLPAGLTASGGTDLLSACLILAAFSLLIPAFLTRSSSRRATLLTVSLSLIAGAALATLASDLLRSVEYGVNHAAGTYVAHSALDAAGDLVLIVAATIGAVAFLSSLGAGRSRRDGKLAWAATVFAISVVFSMAGAILLLIFFSDNHASSGLTSGVGVGVGGLAVEIGAAVVLAVAFFLSQQRRSQGAAWLAAREGLLGLTAAIFAFSFLLSGIGKLIYAGGLSDEGFDGKQVASGWLDGTSSLIELAAAICVAVGFFLSRRFVISAGDPAPAAPAAAGFCSNCGHPRLPGATFCNSCGQPF